MTPAPDRTSPFSEEDLAGQAKFMAKRLREHKLRDQYDGATIALLGLAIVMLDQCSAALAVLAPKLAEAEQWRAYGNAVVAYQKEIGALKQRAEKAEQGLAAAQVKLAAAERQRDAAEYGLLIKEDALQGSEFARMAAETRAEAAQAQLAAFATVVAALRAITDMEGRDGMTDYLFAKQALQIANAALEAYEHAAGGIGDAKI